jgi:hypothetical protein
MLFAFRGVDFENKVGYGASHSSSQYTSRSDAAAPLGKQGGAAPGEGRPKRDDSESEGEDSEDDQAFVGGGKMSGIRQTQRKRDEDSDSDYDL